MAMGWKGSHRAQFQIYMEKKVQRRKTKKAGEQEPTQLLQALTCNHRRQERCSTLVVTFQIPIADTAIASHVVQVLHIAHSKDMKHACVKQEEMVGKKRNMCISMQHKLKLINLELYVRVMHG